MPHGTPEMHKPRGDVTKRGEARRSAPKERINTLPSAQMPPSAAPSKDALVHEYLERFARSLTAGETRKLVQMWALPAFVIGDEVVHAIVAPADLEKFFAGAKENYNARGIVDTRPDLLKLEWISERIALVHVRWPYLDAQGKELGDESSTYILRLDEFGELKLRVALLRGE